MQQTFRETEKDVDELRKCSDNLQSVSDPESTKRLTSETQQLISR